MGMTSELFFNQKMLHRDLLVRLRQLGKNQREIKPVCRGTLNRMRTGKAITMKSFLKCVEYLDHDITRYIYYRKKQI